MVRWRSLRESGEVNRPWGVLVLLVGLAIPACGDETEDFSRPAETPLPSVSADDEQSANMEDESAVTVPGPGPTPSPLVFASPELNLPPGEQGAVSVVMSSAVTETAFAVIVRNATAGAVTEIEVDASLGPELARGRSDRISPAVLGPGEWGFGLVLFDRPIGVTGGSTFEVSSRPASTEARLSVTSVARSASDAASWALTVENRAATPATAVGVDLFCVAGDQVTGFARSRIDDVGAGKSATGIVRLNVPACPSFGAVAWMP